jgi:hypothetical protein
VILIKDMGVISDDCVVFGKRGSEAEKYTIKNGLKFVEG